MQRLKNIQKNFSDFLKTNFSSKYVMWMILSGIATVITLFCLIFCNATAQSETAVKPALTVVSLLFLFYMIMTVSSLLRGIVHHAVKLDELQKKYDLIDIKDKTNYDQSLEAVLNLVDTITEREYSNSLLQKQAELEAMKSQINPHFLYNTLDAIRGYAFMEEAPVTADMIEVLSRIFRYTVSHRQEMVSISQELSIAVDYIKIQEYRANGHIAFLQNVEEDVEIDSCKIPKLILQPLIENAIKHAFSGITREPVINASVYRTQDRLILSVKDNGRGMQPDQVAKLNETLASDEDLVKVRAAQRKPDGSRGTGIALRNINQRIKLIYGKEYGLLVYSAYGEGSEFQLSLPYL